MSEIKVDTLSTVSGSGNLTVSNNIAGAGTISGTNITASGNLTISGTTTATGKITSTAGITFGSDTAAANVLGDYEEGDFTPTLTPGGGSYNGLTLTGKYTKIGRVVSVQMVLVITASGNASGSATVGNLPFTSISWNRMPNKWRENQATGACGQFVMNQNGNTGFMQNDDGTNIAHTTGRTYLINAVYYST